MYPLTRARTSTDATALSRPENSSHSLRRCGTGFATVTRAGAVAATAGACRQELKARAIIKPARTGARMRVMGTEDFQAARKAATIGRWFSVCRPGGKVQHRAILDRSS